MISCKWCGADTNGDCYKLLRRCVSPDCGRYMIAPDTLPFNE